MTTVSGVTLEDPLSDVGSPGRITADTGIGAQQELLALQVVLANLDLPGEPGPFTPRVVPPLSSLDGTRWLVNMRGVKRLTQVAALRERLSRLPGCLATKVMDLTSNSASLVLTTTHLVAPEFVECIVAQSVGCCDTMEAEVIRCRPDRTG